MQQHHPGLKVLDSLIWNNNITLEIVSDFLKEDKNVWIRQEYIYDEVWPPSFNPEGSSSWNTCLIFTHKKNWETYSSTRNTSSGKPSSQFATCFSFYLQEWYKYSGFKQRYWCVPYVHVSWRCKFGAWISRSFHQTLTNISSTERTYSAKKPQMYNSILAQRWVAIECNGFEKGLAMWNSSISTKTSQSLQTPAITKSW